MPRTSAAPSGPVAAPSAGSALLRVEGLTRSYGMRRVLDGLGFEVGHGEVFGLLGPNGAGKTTTFQVLTGLQRPDSGRMFFEGVGVAPGGRALRAQLGVVFQRPSLDDKLTARENLELGAALYAVSRGARARRIEELLGLVELSDRADEPVERYSGGMRRRLELARALVHGPRLLVMDEPTQGLDEASFRRIWRFLLALRDRERLTIILTTHRPEEAEYCDRLGILDGGKLVAVGTPESHRARIGGDVVCLEAGEPQALAEELAECFGVEPVVRGGRITFEVLRGHELIPRLVEAFAPGRIHSVALRRPTLADAFLALTGRTLEGDGSVAEVIAE